MRCRLFHRRRARIRESQEHLAKSDESGTRIDGQWGEVLSLSSWARETRERNHLTQLFMDSRGKA